MIEKIHIIVALLAALAVTILSLFQDVTSYVLCIRLVAVIPAFFILGLFFRLYMKKLFAPPPQQEQEKPDELSDGSMVTPLPEVEEDYNDL